MFQFLPSNLGPVSIALVFGLLCCNQFNFSATLPKANFAVNFAVNDGKDTDLSSRAVRLNGPPNFGACQETLAPSVTTGIGHNGGQR
jgi:hypothetical protein